MIDSGQELEVRASLAGLSLPGFLGATFSAKKRRGEAPPERSRRGRRAGGSALTALPSALSA